MSACDKTFSLTIAPPAAIPTELFGKVGIGHGLASAQGGKSHTATVGTYDMLLFLVYSHNVTGFAALSNVVADFIHPMTLVGSIQNLQDGVYQSADAYWIASGLFTNCQCDFSVLTDYVCAVVPIINGHAIVGFSNVTGNTTPASLTPAPSPLIVTLFGLSGFQDISGIPGGSSHYESSPDQQSISTTYSPSIYVPSGGTFSYPFFFPTKPWILASVEIS